LFALLFHTLHILHSITKILHSKTSRKCQLSLAHRNEK